MKERGKRKVRVGTVVSNKMDKTVVVEVKRLVQHPKFKKTVSQVSRFKAHDEENRCQIGQRVRITETRPLSKDKRWRVVEIMEPSS